MTDGKYGYKLDVLGKILSSEKKNGYGASLSHWAANAGPINLDEKALKCLIRHYVRRNAIEPNDNVPSFAGAKFEIGKCYKSDTMDSIKVVNRRNGRLYFTHAGGGATLVRKIYEHGNETEIIRFHPDHKDVWMAKDEEARE